MPVREAIRLLEGEGFIKLLPRRGAYVTDISVDGLEELYRIREELEALATVQAIPHLTRDQLLELESIVRDMEVTTRAQADSGRLSAARRRPCGRRNPQQHSPDCGSSRRGLSAF